MNWDFYRHIFGKVIKYQPIPVAARSKAWVCGHSPPGVVGSNPIEGMDVCLLWVVRWRSLRLADHSSRRFPPTVVCPCVWSRNLENEETLAHWGLLGQKQTHKQTKKSNIRCENPSSGSRVVPCGRTDRHDEANSHFSKFSKRRLNVLPQTCFACLTK